MRPSVLSVKWQDRSSYSQTFSGADFMSPILVSPHIQKTTKILYGDTVPHASEDFTRLLEAFWKKCFMAWISPSPKITYILAFSPASLEQLLRAIRGAGSRAAASILLQIKLNLQLSHSAFFLLSRHPHIQKGTEIFMVTTVSHDQQKASRD